ncbi:hypothetical protein C8R44DRAFT_863576 [Mycena epipterygia]|nr:hypothetical protein C8R44DRAFT_863576 [Mycena epipterygia]
MDAATERRIFIANAFGSVHDMTRRDGGGTLARRHELAQDLMNAFNGDASTDLGRSFSRIMAQYLGAVFDFVTSMVEDREAGSLMDCLPVWIRSVKAGSTIYVASNGVIGVVPQQHRMEWSDLGAHRCLVDPNVVYLDSGHYEILSNQRLIRELQAGFGPVYFFIQFDSHASQAGSSNTNFGSLSRVTGGVVELVRWFRKSSKPHLLFYLNF